MKKLTELKQSLAGISAKISNILKAAKAGDGSLTDEQRTEIDALETQEAQVKADIAQCEKDIERAERQAARERELATIVETVPAEAVSELGRKRGSGEAEGTWEGQETPEESKRLRKLAASMPKGYKPHSVYPTFGHSLKALISDPYAFGRKQKEVFAAIQGMNEAAGADGGFLVFPEYSSQIFDRVYANDLWSRTDNYPVSGNSIKFPKNAETSRANGSRAGGLRGYWVGEGATITKSSPTVGSLTLTLNKLAVVVYLTEELIADSGPALEAYVTKKVAEEFNFMIGDAIINGVGGGQPLGIVSAPATVSVSKETGQAAATIVKENIDKMWSRMYAPSRQNAIWLINQDTEPQLESLNMAVGTGGMPVYLPPGGIAETPNARLKGRPVIATEFNATLGTVGDIILADLSQYVTINKGGIASAVSMHVEFLTDQMALKFTMRLDGRPWAESALTPFKGSATQSSFVSLATRS